MFADNLYDWFHSIFTMHCNAMNIVKPVILIINRHFIILITLFIIVYVVQLEFTSLTIRFTVISPTLHASNRATWQHSALVK